MDRVLKHMIRSYLKKVQRNKSKTDKEMAMAPFLIIYFFLLIIFLGFIYFSEGLISR